MATSQNGWPAGVDRSKLGVDQGFAPTGVLIAGGVLAGDVATVFAHLIRRFHAEVETLVDGWCWGHHYRAVTGGGSLSNHASATAVDLNAPRHPYGRGGTFPAAKVTVIRSILRDLGGVVRWGGDYSHPDEMHFEIIGDRTQVAAVAARLRGTTEEDEDMTPDQARKLDELHTGWRKGNPTKDVRQTAGWGTLIVVEMLRRGREQVGQIEGLLTALKSLAAGKDVDLAEVEAAAHAGTMRALAEGTVDVDLDVTIGGKVQG